MQSQASQRSLQRRSPVPDPGPPGPPPPGSSEPAPSPVNAPHPRTSISSTKSGLNSGGNRRQNDGQSSQDGQNAPPLSQIEKSVTLLLIATKQLLETLTQWSRHQATDVQVSDVYVKLGYEFNIACRAFTAINVDTSDLGNVPELLRHILESTLSQEASVESLEKYLPRIRDIIINLLKGLKRKQQKLRQKQSSRSESVGDASVPRNMSISSTGSGNTGLTTLLNQGIPNDLRADSSVTGNRDGASSPPNVVPPRSSSMTSTRQVEGLPQGVQSRESLSSDHSTLSSTTMQNMPVLPPPYPEQNAPRPSRPASGELNMDSFPPPPPPPKQQNALAALQRGGDLERRASRRYSTYQLSKHLGASPNGLPMIPAAQNSPLPNRGRNDARESMRAVQTRGEQKHTRQNSSRVIADVSPARLSRQIPEGVEKSQAVELPSEPRQDDSSTAKTPTDNLRKPIDFEGPSATLQGPPGDTPDAIPTIFSPEESQRKFTALPVTPQRPQPAIAKEIPPLPANQGLQFTPEQSLPHTKELTLFLQYKTKVKKFVLPEGYNDLSMARLQLAFIEKFAWNTHNNGVDLPQIYIQDPVSGVRHELEDLNDVKDRSVLVLNIEVLDEVKRHIDEGIGNLKKVVEGVKTAVDDQQASIQRVSDRQQDAAKEMARLATSKSSTSLSTNDSFAYSSKGNSQAQVSEVQSLRRDLAVLRQTYSSFQSDIQSSMSLIRTKASSVKTVAVKAASPDIKGESGRTYVNAGKISLNEDSDKLVAQVDDLQDIVEDLRKDVVLRGVRPLPRQLETVAKDISQATQELKKMQEFMKRERPLWTKIWEKELETVCNDREEMTMQEDLAADLQDDLEKATQTFALVEQATKEQLKEPVGAPRVRGLNHVIATDPTAAKEGVLDEVRALQPNHEDRLEAIERAEKLRQKELESRRGGEFQKELGNFVEEGKLKKAGGFEEVERARKAKDEKIRREVWERQNGITQADALTEPPEPAPEQSGGDTAEAGGEVPPADI